MIDPLKEMKMNVRRMSAVLLSIVLLVTLLGRAAAASPKTEIKGAAILDHPCGKVSVKHMGLVHAGEMEEATKLGTTAKTTARLNRPCCLCCPLGP